MYRRQRRRTNSKHRRPNTSAGACQTRSRCRLRRRGRKHQCCGYNWRNGLLDECSPIPTRRRWSCWTKGARRFGEVHPPRRPEKHRKWRVRWFHQAGEQYGPDHAPPCWPRARKARQVPRGHAGHIRPGWRQRLLWRLSGQPMAGRGSQKRRSFNCRAWSQMFNMSSVMPTALNIAVSRIFVSTETATTSRLASVSISTATLNPYRWTRWRCAQTLAPPETDQLLGRTLQTGFEAGSNNTTDSIVDDVIVRNAGTKAISLSPRYRRHRLELRRRGSTPTRWRENPAGTSGPAAGPDFESSACQDVTFENNRGNQVGATVDPHPHSSTAGRTSGALGELDRRCELSRLHPELR